MESTAKEILRPSDFYIPVFETEDRVIYIGIPIKIKTYGQALFSAPLILINCGLSKSISNQFSENLDKLVGNDKFIDPKKYSIVEFEIDSEQSYSFTYESYRHFSNKDMNSIINIAVNHFNLPEPHLIYTI